MVYDKVILGDGCIFSRTCDILEEKRNASLPKILSGAIDQENVQIDASLHVSIIVNSALASELFLKAMIPPEKIPKNRNGHDLEYLFNLLDDDNRATIRSVVIHELQHIYPGYTNEQFSEALHNQRNAFINWRYFYEGNANPVGDFLLCFMRTIFAVAKTNSVPE